MTSDIRHHRIPRTRAIDRALTLIELLAVVIILSMTAAIGVVSLANIDAQAKIDRLIDRWREMDAKARVLARRESDVALHLDQIDVQSLQLQASHGTGIVATVSIPQSVRMIFKIAEEPVEQISFDARGCSNDYAVEVVSGNATRRWRTSGETGWIDEVGGGEAR